MSRSTGMTIVMACATILGSGFLVPAFAEERDDAAKLLLDSNRLLMEQQEVEAKLATSQTRTEDLTLERRRATQQAEQVNSERQANQAACAMPGYNYTHLDECGQGSAQLSTRGAEVDAEQYRVGRQLDATGSEVESLKARQEQLKRQAEALQLKLKRLELSGTAQDCLSRLPKGDLASTVAAYQQCWDGTGSAEPRFKQKSPAGPSVGGIGPIEQMGIEQEKRRKRRAKQQEAQ